MEETQEKPKDTSDKETADATDGTPETEGNSKED